MALVHSFFLRNLPSISLGLTSPRVEKEYRVGKERKEEKEDLCCQCRTLNFDLKDSEPLIPLITLSSFAQLIISISLRK
jgi:hypothetical protein